MKHKTEIISTVKFIKFNKFIELNGTTEHKLKKIKLANLDKDELIIITAPDGNLFINLFAYHKWCIQNHKDIKIEFVSTGITFITATLYAELTGYTLKAISRKFEDRIWEPPIAFKAPNSELMININKVESWIISSYINGRRR